MSSNPDSACDDALTQDQRVHDGVLRLFAATSRPFGATEKTIDSLPGNGSKSRVRWRGRQWHEP